MYEIEELIGAGIMTVLAVQDWRKRTLSCMELTVLLIAAAGYRIYCGGSIAGWLLGMLPGALFFLISYITREGIGYGDSYVILILGIYLGIRETALICMMAAVIMAFISVAGMVLRHWKKTKRLPFLPFLAAGYLGVILW